MNLSLQPLRDRIVVLPDAVRDDVSAAGIIVAARQGIHTSNEQLGRTGKVVAVGADIDAEQLRVGDRVCFGEFKYAEYHESGTRYLVMQDADICGVVED